MDYTRNVVTAIPYYVSATAKPQTKRDRIYFRKEFVFV